MQKQILQNKAFLFSVTFLFFLSLISAAKASPDISAYSQASLDLCSCSNYTNIIYITNPDAITKSISIKAFNSASGFVKLKLKPFDLYPGETRSVAEKISIPCGFIGGYVLDTRIKDSFSTKTVRQKIRVQDCYSVKLEIEKEYDEICYEQKNYAVKIKNKGTITQPINLSLNGNNAKLDKGLIMLDPGQETTAILAIDPFNAAERIYSVKAKTKVSESTAALNVKAISNNECYKLEFSAPNIETDHSKKTIRMMFENNGIKEGNYALSVEPGWLFLDETGFKLAPKQIREITIAANPLGINQGVYEGKITAAEVSSGEVYEKPFAITIKEKDQTWSKIKGSISVFLVFLEEYWIGILLGLVVLFLFYILIKKITVG
ncbi:hypothetical protein HYU07_04245, partial [Candidatus Woesearchaeota archaeon]|nr:hypothetical protein [Candidatus Woesearchaeota archaeon]